MTTTIIIAFILNFYRTEAHLAPVVVDPVLVSLAQERCNELAQYHPDVFYVLKDHPQFGAYASRVASTTTYTHIGENIAIQRTLIDAIVGWKLSPTHEANNMGDYTHIGVGECSYYGMTIYVETFGA